MITERQRSEKYHQRGGSVVVSEEGGAMTVKVGRMV